MTLHVTRPRPDCRCAHSFDVHDHYRAGTDCGICGPTGCQRYRSRDSIAARLGRALRGRFAVLGALLVLFGAGATVAAPPARANDANCGTTATVVALIGYEHANYQGRQYLITRPSCGAVDAGGYELRGTTAARNNISSIKRGPYGGSGLIIWESNWAGTGKSGTVCFYGSIGAGVPYVGDACNDDTGVWGVYK